MVEALSPPRLSRRTKIFLWALGNVALLAAGLVALEIYLRRQESYVVQSRADSVRRLGLINSDPQYLIQYTPQGRRLIPDARVVVYNHRVSKRDVTVEVNHLGFRDHDLPAVKSPGELRILVLGDSITVGDYLPAEEVYVKRAEQYLQAAYPHRAVEVVNGGVGDVGLKEELDILEERGLALGPEVVVIGWYLNDSRPPWGFPGELGSFGFLRRHSVLAQALYRELGLRRWIKKKGARRFDWPRWLPDFDWEHDRNAFLQLAAKAEFDWGAAWQPDTWTILDLQLARLKRLQEQHGFRVVIVAFPVRFQVEADFIEDRPEREMQVRAERLGFFYLDLLPLLRRNRSQNLYYDYCHPRPPANDLIGQALAEFIQQRVLAEAP